MLFGLIPWGAKPERQAWCGNPMRCGDIVVSFECHGSMGEDHQFQWMGIVDRFTVDKTKATYAIVRPVKFQNVDERDVKLTPYHVYLEDRALQRLPSGIWVIFK